MNELAIFGWVMALMSLLTVVIWGIVLATVLQGAWEMLRDAWRAWRVRA